LPGTVGGKVDGDLSVNDAIGVVDNNTNWVSGAITEADIKPPTGSPAPGAYRVSVFEVVSARTSNSKRLPTPGR